MGIYLQIILPHSPKYSHNPESDLVGITISLKVILSGCDIVNFQYTPNVVLPVQKYVFSQFVASV